jgi:hypothetical protein
MCWLLFGHKKSVELILSEPRVSTPTYQNKLFYAVLNGVSQLILDRFVLRKKDDVEIEVQG